MTATFEACERPMIGSCGKPRCSFGQSESKILERRMRIKHRTHVQGVVFPIGREFAETAGSQDARNKVDEGSLNQTSLIVALLVPRVREKDVDLIDGCRR